MKTKAIGSHIEIIGPDEASVNAVASVIESKQIRQDVEDVITCIDYDFDQAGRHEETLEAYNRVRELMAAAPLMLKALQEAKELIALADKYFPKSIRNSDKFKLLLTDATINKAIHQTRQA